MGQTRLSVSTPFNVFTNYFGGYAQDDWRINSKFTVNYGLRVESERGLSERDNNFTVGFDPALTERAVCRSRFRPIPSPELPRGR